MRNASRSIVLCLTVVGCALDPVVPRGGVPTLDESGSDGFTAVSAGLEHTCALTGDGSAYCWGSNEYGQLGAPSDTTCPRDELSVPCRLRPVLVTGGLVFRKISAGGRITCGLTLGDAVYCWGDNLHGSLGNPALRSSETPVAIAATGIFTDVAAGGEHACGLRSDGVLLCWGLNDFGQVGSQTSALSAATPIAVNTQLRFVSATAGARRTCARQSDGATFCWGATWVITVNGEDTMSAQTTPQRVLSAIAQRFISVAAGTNTTCGITSENRAFCWESSPAGGIGDGNEVGSQTPRAVSGDRRFVAISSGGVHTCGVSDESRVWCWGGDARGQLGISSILLSSRCGASRQACSMIPVPVSGYRSYSQVSAGQGDHSCALTLGGNVFCWGASRMGQRGDGRSLSGDSSPVRTLPPSDL
jgi:alpha-tubulin suppressor-like RCC1 family protein